MKITQWILYGVLTVILASCQRSAPVTAAPAEPFNIKANDVLGIKLGMSLKSYKQAKGRSFAKDCISDDENAEVSCNLTPESFKGKLTVGGADVFPIVSLMFYKQRLIEIQYSLVSDDWDPLKKSLQEKFGKSSASYEGRWSNEVSSIRLVFLSDNTAANLEMQLDKESDEWLDWYKQRQDAKAKRDL